jgi:nucleoside-diphosphate-sugar epimerase
MPAISSTDKVLVTGTNEYIALWIAKVLLERGNSVRVAVSSDSEGDRMKQPLESCGDRLELVVVPEITKVRWPFTLLFIDLIALSLI